MYGLILSSLTVLLRTAFLFLCVFAHWRARLFFLGLSFFICMCFAHRRAMLNFIYFLVSFPIFMCFAHRRALLLLLGRATAPNVFRSQCFPMLPKCSTRQHTRYTESSEDSNAMRKNDKCSTRQHTRYTESSEDSNAMRKTINVLRGNIPDTLSRPKTQMQCEKR
jgi:hypothetical protein